MPDLNNDSKTLGKVMDGLAGNFPGELAFDKTPYVVTDELGNVVQDTNGDPEKRCQIYFLNNHSE
jgi:hypothetical protein